MSNCSERITEYLCSGGLFNPELANHDAVRDLLIACRDELAAARADADALAAKFIDVMAEKEAAERECERLKRRLAAIMPLFEEARDALPAISETTRRLHNISPTLAERMDDVGIPSRWEVHEDAFLAQHAAARQPGK